MLAHLFIQVYSSRDTRDQRVHLKELPHGPAGKIREDSDYAESWCAECQGQNGLLAT